LKIVFTVINDLTHDRRMDRICNSLALNGFHVTLVGRVLPTSVSISEKPYQQKRLKCWVNKGLLFYAEYNIRLFFYLLVHHFNVYGAIDLDTILPNKWIATLKRKPWVYDAHEYFTEVIEIQHKPNVKKFWQWVERLALNKNTKGYTVSKSYAMLFQQKYGCKLGLVRNCPPLEEFAPQQKFEQFTFVYVGVVNQGRGIAECIAAIKGLNANLLVCGNGDILENLQQTLPLDQIHQVTFTGFMPPLQLEEQIRKSHVGLLLIDDSSLSYVYSLANKFFDYVHGEIPQITVDYQEYRLSNQAIEVAALCPLQVQEISKKMQQLLLDTSYYQQLVENTKKAKQVWNWQQEEKTLLNFYHEIAKSI
jgi:glycosyltransferase involved in cell wall biosynthesis